MTEPDASPRIPSPRNARPAPRRRVLRATLSSLEVLKAGLPVSLFCLRYMRSFRPVEVGGRVFLHSHLPPLDHPAYRRFVREHLAGRSEEPSHAQVGLTAECPHRCEYCYNRGRAGRTMDTPTLLSVIRDLREMGVFWVGFTGGEPLLHPELVRLTEAAADGCAVKLFTTGTGLTRRLADDLAAAGMTSVSVSLDDARETVHDAARGRAGAYQEALRAIDVLLDAGRLHVGVSAVLARAAIRDGGAERFLDFAAGLGVHEAWVSEVKPSSPPLWDPPAAIEEEDRLALVRLQDLRNRRGGMTVNYLGHFEGRERFGCNAGRKMVYVDAFGGVSPCVFIPASFGNVRERPLRDIVEEMRARMRPQGSCFVNRNWRLIRRFAADGFPLGPEAARSLADAAEYGAPSEFRRLYDRRNPGSGR